MDTFSSSNVTDGHSAEVTLGLLHGVIHGIKDLTLFHASAAITITAILLSGFKAGREILNRILWFFDRLLGGAPHTVTLPSPPGLPIVGNLFEVGYFHTHLQPF